jgi:hypothetical protein
VPSQAPTKRPATSANFREVNAARAEGDAPALLRMTPVLEAAADAFARDRWNNWRRPSREEKFSKFGQGIGKEAKSLSRVCVGGGGGSKQRGWERWALRMGRFGWGCCCIAGSGKGACLAVGCFLGPQLHCPGRGGACPAAGSLLEHCFAGGCLFFRAGRSLIKARHPFKAAVLPARLA